MDTDSAFTMAQRAANKIDAPLHYRYELCFAAFAFPSRRRGLAEARTVRRLGLCKIAAIRAAQNRATISQLNAIFGSVCSAVAMNYTQAARWWRDEQVGAALLEQKGHVSRIHMMVRGKLKNGNEINRELLGGCALGK
jgi:hypothetical protein